MDQSSERTEKQTTDRLPLNPKNFDGTYQPYETLYCDYTNKGHLVGTHPGTLCG